MPTSRGSSRPTDPPTDADLLAGLTVEFVRSPRRRRSITARLNGDRLLLRVPVGMTPEQEREWATRLAKRLLDARRRQDLNAEGYLRERAQELNRRYFGGRLRFSDVAYVTDQHGRFGSCTTARGTIRISDRVARMPEWVRDAVLVHELAHLEEANHSSRFWKLANAYPLMERARGYLIAVGLEADADDAERE